MNNILFTGATGFLGENTLPVLQQHGFKVTTLGLAGSDVVCDLSREVPVLPTSYPVVLHAAGKAHVVPKTPEEEKQFFEINLQGTKNLCAGLEQSGVPKAFVFISTVAVYGTEQGENIEETHPLNGDSPYAKSKIEAERFLTDWCRTNGVILTVLRPSLIAGKNPPGNLGAMIRGIETGRYVGIGGSKARKSVLMAGDIARLVPLVMEKGGVYNVCDSVHPSFGELEQLIAAQLGKSRPVNIPYVFAKMLALVGDLLGAKAPINSPKLDKITQSLTFSNEKARRELGWDPLNVLDHFKIS
ncbi:NAD-dependent epimerase/dehydratase family protein [Gaoshiqia sediminis]|uniref:NAD-dependent epimerase/dehydratase family protein n=1 Tax=Gaoshiqia sediminis TaxID=2986998 RepID=A0AA41Y7A2_9BACT|nr:NAD-dependent epimerase/dehydratase family protein [Gaoshiqia sediminis]MCW0484746.1 NAD-dependent epimerase/dehydratase family protein [Gaoshiqia sediminis]